MQLIHLIAVALQAIAPQPSARPGQAPVHIKGQIRDSDYPVRLAAHRIEGDVKVQYTVGLDGRVTNCRILESSRSAELDALTCRLIVKRFRFRPARDADGKEAVADIVETHSWIVGPRPSAEPTPPRRR